jgi:hypothetical protein
MKSASLRSNPERLFSLRNVLVLLAGIASSLVVYLLAYEFACCIGFPLDDSWIHQSYARNLALPGEWSFLPV